MAPVEICLYGAAAFAVLAGVLKCIDVWMRSRYNTLTWTRKKTRRTFK